MAARTDVRPMLALPLLTSGKSFLHLRAIQQRGYMARLTTIGSRLSTLDTRTSRPPPKTAEADLLTPERKAWRLAVAVASR